MCAVTVTFPLDLPIPAVMIKVPASIRLPVEIEQWRPAETRLEIRLELVLAGGKLSVLSDIATCAGGAFAIVLVVL